MYKILSTFLLSSLSIASLAQSNYEIFNMTTQFTQGSSRSMGLGGASASLGGEYTGVVNNPATLGVYRTTQAGFTMALDFDNSQAAIQSKEYDESRTWFSINQLYLVGSSADAADKKNISSWSWGVGMNRVANFNRKTDYTRENSVNSYIDGVTANYNLNGNQQAWYAWDVGLTDTVGGQMVTAFDQNGNPLKQRQVLQYSGSLNDINLSAAYNHENKIMLGAGLGIPVGAIKRIQTYQESDESDNIANLNYFDYYEESRTTIVGINAKLGLLYQPKPNIRLAAFYQSPTAYALEDTFFYNFRSDVEGYAGLYAGVQSADFLGQYSYGLIGASNYGLSGTFLFGRKGLITFDYIRQNPQNAKIRLDDIDNDLKQEINSSLKQTFEGINTFKIGAEVRVKRLYIRGGGNFTSAPYQNLSSFAGEQSGFSLGLGYRTAHVAYDLVYTRQSIKFSDEPYYSGLEDGTAMITDHINRIGISIGFR